MRTHYEPENAPHASAWRKRRLIGMLKRLARQDKDIKIAYAACVWLIRLEGCDQTSPDDKPVDTDQLEALLK
jgi:hypothetical protein